MPLKYATLVKTLQAFSLKRGRRTTKPISSPNLKALANTIKEEKEVISIRFRKEKTTFHYLSMIVYEKYVWLFMKDQFKDLIKGHSKVLTEYKDFALKRNYTLENVIGNSHWIWKFTILKNM